MGTPTNYKTHTVLIAYTYPNYGHAYISWTYKSWTRIQIIDKHTNSWTRVQTMGTHQTIDTCKSWTCIQTTMDILVYTHIINTHYNTTHTNTVHVHEPKHHVQTTGHQLNNRHTKQTETQPEPSPKQKQTESKTIWTESETETEYVETETKIGIEPQTLHKLKPNLHQTQNRQ